MDSYSLSAGVGIGNELARNAREQNSDRITSNGIALESAARTVTTDKEKKRTDTEEKVGLDTYGGLEGVASAKNMTGRDLIGETKSNLKSALGSSEDAAPVSKSLLTRSATDPSISIKKGFTVDSELPKTSTIVKPSDVGLTSAEDVAVDSGKLAKGLTADKVAFSGLGEAGGVGRFLANRVGGLTSEVGVEVGGKALGGLGGAISAGTDITNLVQTGHIFKKGESGWSEAGNITSMAGAALDMASIAVPILAPLALATNLFSAVAGTVGAEQDDKKQISTDSKPPAQEPLSASPAWAATGMVASQHQQTIA